MQWPYPLSSPSPWLRPFLSEPLSLSPPFFHKHHQTVHFFKKIKHKFYFKFNIKGKTITHYCICTVNVCFLLNIFHFKQNIYLVQLKDYTLHINFFPIFLTQRKSIFVENTYLQAQINFQEIFQTLSDQHINSCSGQHIYWALPEFIQFIFDHPWGLQQVLDEISVFLLHSLPTVLFHAHRAFSHLVDLGSQRCHLCIREGNYQHMMI